MSDVDPTPRPAKWNMGQVPIPSRAEVERIVLNLLSDDEARATVYYKSGKIQSFDLIPFWIPAMDNANEKQVGGSHYKVGGEEHWDRVARLGLDYFQGQITKYVERWRQKNGVEDLEKAAHFLQKYIEVEKARAAAPVAPSNLGRVKPTGYADFTYEGGTSEWDLYRCKKCRAEVKTTPEASPYGVHYHDDAADASSRYVDQG